MQKKDDDENIEASRDLNLYNSNQVNFWNSAQTYDSYNMSHLIWLMLYDSYSMTHVKTHPVELNRDDASETGNTLKRGLLSAQIIQQFPEWFPIHSRIQPYNLCRISGRLSYTVYDIRYISK